MKASKQVKKNVVQLVGNVVQKKIAKGSKSEHDAICIETDQGDYILRRLGENPFSDPQLQKLVGKQITVNGTINGSLFLATDITVVTK